jgi:hypothetical protein
MEGAMMNTRDAAPRRTVPERLRSGEYFIEYYDQDDGGVAAQARGPIQPTGTTAFGSGGDGGRGVIARALGATDDEAMDALRARLRAKGELP